MANQNANDNDTNVINADNNSSNANSNRNDDHDAYEKVCYVCRRPESKAGKMCIRDRSRTAASKVKYDIIHNMALTPCRNVFC